MSEKEGYDPYAAFARLADAGESIDARAILILTYHLALERELNLVLEKMLLRPLKSGVGFVNKAKLLHAFWKGSNDDAEMMFQVLNAFNELRNQIAHNNTKTIESLEANLFAAYRAIDPAAPEKLDYGFIAQGVCAFIGDGMMPGELTAVAARLDGIMNSWPNGDKGA